MESDKEIDELRLKVAEGEERLKEENERQKFLMSQLDSKESKIMMVEKDCQEAKAKYEELLYNYHTIE